MSQASTGLTNLERKALNESGRQLSQARGPPDAESWALTLQETADKLNISLSSVRRRIADGSLKAVRFGCLTRVLMPEIQRYMVDAPSVQYRKS
jgi:excisionase family DNA binding protein